VPAMEGTPALQLAAVPQSLEDVLVHVSTWARATPAVRHRAAPARILQRVA
jgi:hypothetical protein